MIINGDNAKAIPAILGLAKKAKMIPNMNELRADMMTP